MKHGRMPSARSRSACHLPRNTRELRAASWPKPVPFLQCRWYLQNYVRPAVTLWVVHCMEAPEARTTAFNCARYLSTLPDGEPKRSAHHFYDSDNVIDGVLEENIAYHAPGANSDGIGAEHAGFARQNRDEWLDDFGVRMLHLSARGCALAAKRWGFPLSFASADQLVAGAALGNKRARGVTTHWEVTKAFHRSTHTDPGDSFPMDYYLEEAQKTLASL